MHYQGIITDYRATM